MVLRGKKPLPPNPNGVHMFRCLIRAKGLLSFASNNNPARINIWLGGQHVYVLRVYCRGSAITVTPGVLGRRSHVHTSMRSYTLGQQQHADWGKPARMLPQQPPRSGAHLQRTLRRRTTTSRHYTGVTSGYSPKAGNRSQGTASSMEAPQLRPPHNPRQRQ